MQEQYEKLRRYYKPILLVLVFALVLLIGWIRFLTGPEFAFSFLYMLPIITVTWLVGIHWGILVSVVSTFSWLWAHLSMIDRFSNSYIPLVNESFRLMVFLFMVLMITRHKKILETQKELAMMQNNQWRVTFSIGLATYHSAPGNVDETIKAADELMYHAKHNGKNNIRHAVLKT